MSHMSELHADADEQQFQAEWMAHQEEMEADQEYHDWLNQMATYQECEQ
jgi:hypothetical protein